MAHATVTVYLDQIKQNLMKIKEGLPNETKLLLSAKANAYGLGVIPICDYLKDTLNFIGVISTKEAIEIRNAGIQTPILLLSEPIESDIPTLIANDIAVTVYNKITLKTIESYTSKTNQPIKTHYKVDTGMIRQGKYWESAEESINTWLNSSPTLVKEGFYTHFANSEIKNHSLNDEQNKRFQTLINTLPKDIITHSANSGAITNIKNSEYKLVRIGLNAYKNAFDVTSNLIEIKTIPKNTSVGYGSKYTSSKEMTIGVIGMGYADGIPTHLSNKGHVTIHQTHCPIIGQICMDMFMVEIPSTITPSIGDSVTVISKNNSGMSLEDISALTNYNPREIMVNLSQRVKRVYK